MESEAIKVFSFILDNSLSINKEIQLKLYEILGVDDKKMSLHRAEDAKIKETIVASIENFSFNLQESNFLNQIKEIIEDEMNKLKTSKDYNLLQNSLLTRFSELKNIDIFLEDDFKELSKKIANPVISRDMFYNYFISKKEQINDMIKSYNQAIINTLITLTPQLVNSIQENSNAISDGIQHSPQEKVALEENEKNLNKSAHVIDSNIIKQKIINLLQQKLDDIDNHFNKFMEFDDVVAKESQINGVSKIAKYYRQIKKIITDIQSNNITVNDMVQGQENELCDKLLLQYASLHKDSTQIIEEYKKGVVSVENYINNFALELHSKISLANSINDLLKYKKEIETELKKYNYLKHEKLDLELSYVNDKIINLTGPEINSPKTPYSPNSLSTSAEVGVSNESMIQLINSGSYFSVLQGITDNNIFKYKNFINNGFNVIYDRWISYALQAKTYEQRMESYRGLQEIYNQFKRYLQSEKDKLNMLETMLASLDEYFMYQQNKYNQMNYDGIRYNTFEQENNKSAMRR